MSKMKVTIVTILFSLLLFTSDCQNVIYLNPGCNKFDEAGDCISCSVRFYKDNNGICQPVNPNCNGYNPITGACTTCYPGFGIIENTCLPQFLVQGLFDPFCNQFQGSVCVKCSFGYFFNQQGRCKQADPNCRQHDQDNGFCISCFQGFQLQGNSCIPARQQARDPNCNQFQNGECIKCSFGFYFNDFNICTLIPVDCANFDIINRVCRGCYAGYALNENNQCQQSLQQGGDPHCNQFNNGICIKCSFGFYFNDQNICTKIPDDCQAFSILQKKCKQCYAGYQLNLDYECVESQQSLGDPNCNQFDSDRKCIKCSFGFYFNNQGNCKKIPDDCFDFRAQQERCIQCYSGYALDDNNECVQSQEDLSDPNCNQFKDGVCLKCSFGFYFNAFRVCTKIPDQCKNYDTKNQKCLQCYAGYALVDDKCQQSEEDITDRFCKKWENNTCVQCSQGAFLTDQNYCKLVNPLCKTYNLDNGACTSCYPGFTLNDNECQVASALSLDPNCKQYNGQVCVQCSFRFFKNFEGDCQSVNPLCKTYSQFNGACTSCYIGFKTQGDTCVEDQDVLDDPNCANWIDGICAECSFGSFFGSDGKCQLVDLLCKTYDERDGSCLTCYPAFILQGTKCVQDKGFASQDPFCSQFNNGQCVKCSNGFYFSSVDGVCTKVSDLCQTYDINTGACLSCYVGFILDTQTGFCIQDDQILSDNNCAQFIDGICAKCSKGFFFNQQRICQVANPLCKQFDITNGDCTQCYIGFTLQNGDCIISQQSETRDPNCAQWLDQSICLRCSQRAFFNELGLCQLVSVDCNTFDVLTGKCTTCYAGYDLDSNTGECRRSTSQSGCLQRDQNGICKKCSFRSYLNDQNVCTAVDDLCAQFDYDRKTCIGCYSGYSLLNTKCQITEVQQGKQIQNCFAYTIDGNCLECFDRFYLSQIDQCTQVDLFCKGYDKNTGECTSCYEGLGFKLQNGKCVK